MTIPTFPARWRLKNNLIATVERQVQPRGAAPYFEGGIDGGGACQWDEKGRDLRGYEECDLREPVDV